MCIGCFQVCVSARLATGKFPCLSAPLRILAATLESDPSRDQRLHSSKINLLKAQKDTGKNAAMAPPKLCPTNETGSKLFCSISCRRSYK